MAKTNPTSFLPGNEDGNIIVHTDEDGNPLHTRIKTEYRTSLPIPMKVGDVST